jgi:hypothetical protein
MTYTVNGKMFDEEPRAGSACVRLCARWSITASRRGATRVIAAPAQCGSTADRYTAASPRRSVPTTVR